MSQEFGDIDRGLNMNNCSPLWNGIDQANKMCDCRTRSVTKAEVPSPQEGLRFSFCIDVSYLVF